MDREIVEFAQDVADRRERRRPYWKVFLRAVPIVLIALALAFMIVFMILKLESRASMGETPDWQFPSMRFCSFFQVELSKWDTPTGDMRSLHLKANCYMTKSDAVESLGHCLWGDKAPSTDIGLHTPTKAEEEAIRGAVSAWASKESMRKETIIPVIVQEVKHFKCPEGQERCILPVPTGESAFLLLFAVVDAAIDSVAGQSFDRIRQCIESELGTRTWLFN